MWLILHILPAHQPLFELPTCACALLCFRIRPAKGRHLIRRWLARACRQTPEEAVLFQSSQAAHLCLQIEGQRALFRQVTQGFSTTPHPPLALRVFLVIVCLGAPKVAQPFAAARGSGGWPGGAPALCRQGRRLHAPKAEATPQARGSSNSSGRSSRVLCEQAWAAAEQQGRHGGSGRQESGRINLGENAQATCREGQFWTDLCSLSSTSSAEKWGQHLRRRRAATAGAPADSLASPASASVPADPDHNAASSHAPSQPPGGLGLPPRTGHPAAEHWPGPAQGHSQQGGG